MNQTEVWARIKTADSIHVARGKEVDVFNPNASPQDAVLKAVMGRSGNLRAPTLQLGDAFFVGFNAKLYEAVLTT